MGEGGDGRGDMSEVEIDQSREMIGQSETTTNVADTDDVADKTGTDMPEDTGRFKNLSVKRIADSKSQGRERHLPHETSSPCCHGSSCGGALGQAWQCSCWHVFPWRHKPNALSLWGICCHWKNRRVFTPCLKKLYTLLGMISVKATDSLGGSQTGLWLEVNFERGLAVWRFMGKTMSTRQAESSKLKSLLKPTQHLLPIEKEEMKCGLQMFVEWLCVFDGQQLWTHQRDGTCGGYTTAPVGTAWMAKRLRGRRWLWAAGLTRWCVG